MGDFDYDLFVIGGGSGGVRAARVSSQMGAKVALAEEYRYGGTCVIRGCVPKKLMVYASEFSHAFEIAEKGFGWSVGQTSFDWKALISNKDKEIDRLENIYATNLGRAGVQIVRSRAVLRGANSVYLEAEDREVTAKHILIATGGWPFKPEIPGIENAITSNEVFHLEDQPRRVIVVGGGYIAVEFAGIFKGLGSSVTQIYRREKLLRGFDMDLRDGLMHEMAHSGIDILTNEDISSIEKTDTGLIATLKSGGLIEADCILYATGRVPNTLNMGLEDIGIKTAENGAIVVNEFSETSVPGIYAVGDVTDRVNLTPVAIREGMAFAETVFNSNPTSPDHDLIPTAVFSQPSIGTVGLSEEEARAQFGEIDIYKSSFRPMKITMTDLQEKMLMKLIIETKTQIVRGVHIMGPDAGEMIQAIGIAVKMGATKQQFDATMAVHPTAAEELVTMREKWVPPAQAAE